MHDVRRRLSGFCGVFWNFLLLVVIKLTAIYETSICVIQNTLAKTIYREIII